MLVQLFNSRCPLCLLVSRLLGCQVKIKIKRRNEISSSQYIHTFDGHQLNLTARNLLNPATTVTAFGGRWPPGEKPPCVVCCSVHMEYGRIKLTCNRTVLWTVVWLNRSTGDPSPMPMEPTACQSKRGVAFDFQDANDLDALAPGMSWW